VHPAYQEHVLNAVDVCQNCLRIVREERQPHEPRRSDVSVRESKWSRRRDTTAVAYGPADSPSEAKGVFCDCGVEGSFTRIWDDEDITREQFREFVKRLVQSLEHKGVSVDRKTTVAHALDAYDDRSGPYRRYRTAGEVDAWLSDAVRYGLARAEASARAHPTA
jgi:hypothetical protein